jgi:hypothetical protein
LLIEPTARSAARLEVFGVEAQGSDLGTTPLPLGHFNRLVEGSGAGPGLGSAHVKRPTLQGAERGAPGPTEDQRWEARMDRWEDAGA